MDFRKIVLRHTAIVAVGELVCSGVMVGVFAVLGYFHRNVLWSALAGSALMVINYFFMAITVSLAADRAERGQVQEGKKLVRLSSTVRLVCMGILLLAGIKLGGNVIALVLPLAFLRPILMLADFFGKKEN